MADTANYAMPYPTGGNAVAVHSDIEKLAKSVDAQALQAELRADSAIPYRGYLDQQSGTLATLKQGRYEIRYTGTAEAWGMPQRLLGFVEVTGGDLQKMIRYTPNDAGAGLGTKTAWELATNSSGVLRDRWQRFDKSIMRSSPVVLTAPAGEYGPIAASREAVRLPFTVPTDVAKVRVHMRPWNYRTEKSWGPAKLEGVMIARQSGDGSGTITGGRWYAPDAEGATVPSTGWTSEWFYVGLTEGSTFLLSYGAEWLDESRDAVLGQCWTHTDRAEFDSTADAIYQNGWGEFGLQPMDIWIECEAPSTVPVYGYFGASNTMGMNADPSVFGSYPQLHARRNGAFCALTAAGGWSIMDSSAHKLDTTRRFGYPGRLYDRLYLDWGSNMAVRGATLEGAKAELERWMNTNKGSFGSPAVYMMTQISRYDSDDTSDFAGTLSPWNEWIRYEVSERPEVRGVIDFAAIFADPDRPWTARQELRASPGDVHFGTNGQRMRAQALDGEITLPPSNQKNPDDVPWRAGFEWAGEPNASESVMKVGDREAARNLYLDPALTDPSTWSTADTVTSIELGPSWTGNANSTGFSLYGEPGSIHAGASSSHRIPVSPGDVVTMGVNLATSEGFTLRARIYWYDSSGNFITSEDSPNQPSSGEKVFTRVVVTGTAPEGAASVCPYFWLYKGNVNSTVPATGYIDGITMERGVTDGAYFDGDTAGWDRLDRLEDRSRDTGWRDVTGDLINGWTATRVEIRRDGKWGVLRFQGLDGSAASGSYFLPGMPGFFVGGQNVPLNVGAAMYYMWINSVQLSLSLNTSTPPSSVPTTATQYLGDLDWPTTYPGIPG